MLSSLRRSLLPRAREEVLRIEIDVRSASAGAQRCLGTLRHVRSVWRRVDTVRCERCRECDPERFPKNRVDGETENLAPRESVLTGIANAKAAERSRNLKAVVEP